MASPVGLPTKAVPGSDPPAPAAPSVVDESLLLQATTASVVKPRKPRRREERMVG
jgi:hypothetical protein